MHVGQRIKERRKELQMSVDDLAKRLNKNRATIYRYEKGDIENLPINILEPLAKALDTTPQYLFGWENDNSDQQQGLDISGDLTIGDVIKALRLSRSLTQEECSVECGIPLKDLQMYENGSKQLSGNIINTIAHFFGVKSMDIASRILYSEKHDTVQLSFQKEYVEQLRKWNEEFGYNTLTAEEINEMFQYGRFLKWKRKTKG